MSVTTPLSGRLGNLSPEQEKTLAALKSELDKLSAATLEEYGPRDPGSKEWKGFIWDDETRKRVDDPWLLRFLRARRFVLPATLTMFIASETWRVTFGVAHIVSTFEFPEKDEVDKYYPQFYHKTDKHGRPIYIEQLGNLDFTALEKVTTYERLVERLVWEYERFLQVRLRGCGEGVETSCTILDLGGVSLTKFRGAKDYVFEAAKIGQNYYPEVMGRFYIINAPWAFTAVWSMIKPWLDVVTVQKVHILGSAYQKPLLEVIDADSLPVGLGGTCECAEEGGCMVSDAGPWKAERQILNEKEKEKAEMVVDMPVAVAV